MWGHMLRRSAAELDKMRKAGQIVAEIKAKTRAFIRDGVTTLEIDLVAREIIEKRGAKSNFLNYHGFPATVCTSPNSMIVHGIPSDLRLIEGDIISIDCGAIWQGYHGDAAYTIGVGKISKDAQHLIDVTRESLQAGIAVMYPGNHLHEIGRAVQNVAEGNNMAVVREYVGHGIGTQMHESPNVPNYWPGTPGPKLRTGNVFAVEPMVNLGTHKTKVLPDGWSVVTQDGSLSAHFEETIAITDNGPEVFTAEA